MPRRPFPVLAIGTKLDRESDRGINKEEEDLITREHHLPEIIEVSSKTGENVEQVITTISKMIKDRSSTASNYSSSGSSSMAIP